MHPITQTTEIGTTKTGPTYRHTADFTHIDFALKARWTPFLELIVELEAFTPKVVADFADYRKSELSRLQILNPTSSEADLLTLIDRQIKSKADPVFQIQMMFSERVMSEYVTVAFLAHALVEATINAILAIGLATSGAEEIFSLLERADIKEKWVTGPKVFHLPYSLPKGSALYQTLHYLTRQRNAFVHCKIELEIDGEKKLEGSRFDRAPMKTQIEWIKRFFSLPYDLADHAHMQIPNPRVLLLLDSYPIQRFVAHKVN